MKMWARSRDERTAFLTSQLHWPGAGQTVTDGHEVSLRVSREDYALRILNQIDAGNGASQRSLARRVGIALGLTNIVLKDLVRQGWVRVSDGGRPVRYVITPEGLAERRRISTARARSSSSGASSRYAYGFALRISCEN